VKLEVSGTVTESRVRHTADGVPTLMLQIDDPGSRQCVRVFITWRDGSHASQFVAGATRARLRNQSIHLVAHNPRFRKGRMDCEVSQLAGLHIIEGST
jgi:hypothetical protein